MRPDGILGQYEVLEEIGRGGMGVVLKALDSSLNRVVAIKVLSPCLASSATARLRFVREGKAAAAVCQDNIVTVYGVNETDGLPYLVMQYIAGESLQDRLDRSGPLELTDVIRIGLQTASGLAAAHAQGLIHRDIKPANLLLENGLARVKITDFGLARMTDDVQLTQNGVVAGTPEFMAPEQARGEPVHHRADLFSLGSVLYAMCTGVPPFRGSTALAVLRKVSDQTPSPIRSLTPSVPAWMEMLVDRLMTKNPDDRFQSAAEVAGLLEGYLAHLRQPVTVLPPMLPLSPIRKAPRSPWAAFGYRLSAFGKQWRRPIADSRWPAVALILLTLGLAIAWGVARPNGGADSKTASFQEYYQSFRGLPESSRELAFIGPDTDQCVHYEPAGLRITLPAGYPGKRPDTGLNIGVAVQGDFEITVSFEILHESKAGDGGLGQTRFTLDLGADRARIRWQLCRARLLTRKARIS